MRYSFLLLLLAISFGLAGCSPAESKKSQLPELRKERRPDHFTAHGALVGHVEAIYRGTERIQEHEDLLAADGTVTGYRDTLYLGKEHILLTDQALQTNKYGMRLIRSYSLNGEDTLDEIDYDDGTQEVRLYKNHELSGLFKRKPGGALEAASSEELAALDARRNEALKTPTK